MDYIIHVDYKMLSICSKHSTCGAHFLLINALSEGGFRVTKSTNLLIFKTSKSSRLSLNRK